VHDESVTTVNPLPIVSVIVPCRNEAGWIAPCLESILSNDYPTDRLEVLVVDGMSDDGTRPIVAQFTARYSFARLIDNPKKITPTALNIGIAAAQGAVVMRMDAHVEYPPDYISTLVDHLEQSGADNVGGVCLTCPASDTAMARAIAAAMSHRLGVGNSHFRIGSAKPRWVDTVPFGCYRREVFDRIGVFDEELARNQDDEFNLRLIRRGGRILLVPEVVLKYYARDSLARLWRMYFQYGYFKPLVIRKIGRVMTVRQVMPSLFVAALVVFGIAAVCSKLAMGALALLVGAYLLAIALVASAALKRQGLATASCLFAVFPTLHFAYGVGFLKGALHFLILRRRGAADAAEVPISR
jgi:glycosyltransferase involved in cell wall biosynthesis